MSKESEALYDAITQVDDALLPEPARPKRQPPSWRAFAAIAAVLALLVSPFVLDFGTHRINVTKEDPFTLAQPVYPEMAAYPDEAAFGDDYDAVAEAYRAWQADIVRQTNQPSGYANGLDAYLRQSTQVFLTGAGTENRSYSPLNVYMALAMLAETADGESRSQILTLLGAESIDTLRAQASAVWNANYRDDGMTKSVLASSLWLRDDTDYNQTAVDTLAQSYYASVFRGEMGSDAYNQALQSWLNEQTGGLLEKQAAMESFDSRTALGLATTICFQTKWAAPFSESATQTGVFHAATGDETPDLMHRREAQTYYWGERFGAVALPLESGGAMWLLLPDEGVTPETLLADDEAMDFILHGSAEWANSKDLLVNLSLPKFDTASHYSLLEGLKDLGVTDICDPAKADFSPMLSDAEGVYLDSANHAVRVAIDEEGVVAAAYTVMAEAGAGAPPDDEIDFTLDRPFVFAITGDQGLPLFIGIVNHVSDM